MAEESTRATEIARTAYILFLYEVDLHIGRANTSFAIMKEYNIVGGSVDPAKLDGAYLDVGKRRLDIGCEISKFPPRDSFYLKELPLSKCLEYLYSHRLYNKWREECKWMDRAMSEEKAEQKANIRGGI